MKYRGAVVCQGLLCVVLLVGIIWMAIKHTVKTDQLQRNMDQLQLINNNLTQDRDLCQSRITNLTAKIESEYCKKKLVLLGH